MEKAMAKLKLVAAKKEEAAEPHFSALKSNSKPVMVPVSKLLIDERYQYNPQTEDGRLAKLNKWLAMSGGYDPAKAGVIHVSERKNGDLYVVDGYGRVWMGSRLVDNPIKEIPAIIHNDLQQWEDEAKLFVELNKNKRIIKKSHLFVVAANAGHEPEASILKIVRSYGYAVERMVHRNGAIIAPGALIFAHKLGHEVLERSLNILRSSWGDNHVVGNHVVQVAAVIAIKPDLDDDRIVKIYSTKLSAEEGMKKSRVQAQKSISSRNPQSRDTNPYFSRITIGLYNLGLGKKAEKSKRIRPSNLFDLQAYFDDEHQYKDVWNFVEAT